MMVIMTLMTLYLRQFEDKGVVGDHDEDGGDGDDDGDVVSGPGWGETD